MLSFNVTDKRPAQCEIQLLRNFRYKLQAAKNL